MNNYFAYLKLCAYEKNIQTKDLAIYTNRNIGYINRILNYKIYNPDDETLLAIEERIGLNHEKLIQKQHDFECLFFDYMNVVYTTRQKESDTLYAKIIHDQEVLNTPYEIYVLLTQLVQKTLKGNFDEEFFSADKKLTYIYNGLEDEAKSIYMIYHFGALVLNQNYQNAKRFMSRVDKIKTNNDQLKMMKSYYLFIYHSRAGKTERCLHYYEECKKWCAITENTTIPFSLEITYGVYLMKNYQYKKAIEHNLVLLKTSYKLNGYNERVILNNIARGYTLLHNYEKALYYYLKAIKNVAADISQCFDIAWCYYKTNNNKKARQFIIKANKLNIQNEQTLLLEWLEAMINKPYSNRCSELLEKALNIDGLSEDSKNFVLVQLEDYYYHTKEYEKAREMANMLIKQYFSLLTEK